MAIKEKKKKVSSSGMSTKEKMLARKKALEAKGNNSGFVFCKKGVTRIRIKSPGPDEELGIELIQFYLGNGIGTIISPQTFGEPCPIMEKYDELRNSDSDEDKELAKLMVPKRRYALGGLVYEDEKGKKIGYDGKDRVILVTRQVYQDVVNLYLDEDEAGDMTDPRNGYDIKVTRTGEGQFDTSYSVQNCKPTALDKPYRGEVPLEKMVRAQIKSYEELEEILKKFLNESGDDDDDDEPKPKKKSSKVSSKKDSKDLKSKNKKKVNDI